MSAEHSELLFRSRPLPLCHRSFFQANQRGAVIVMVAILMVVVIGGAASAVDRVLMDIETEEGELGMTPQDTHSRLILRCRHSLRSSR